MNAILPASAALWLLCISFDTFWKKNIYDAFYHFRLLVVLYISIVVAQSAAVADQFVLCAIHELCSVCLVCCFCTCSLFGL